jgi:hypothetical protein
MLVLVTFATFWQNGLKQTVRGVIVDTDAKLLLLEQN